MLTDSDCLWSDEAVMQWFRGAGIWGFKYHTKQNLFRTKITALQYVIEHVELHVYLLLLSPLLFSVNKSCVCVFNTVTTCVNPLVPKQFHDFPSKYASLKGDHGHEWVNFTFKCRKIHLTGML